MVQASDSGGQIKTEVLTAADGSYRLGVFEDTWQIDALVEAQGFEPLLSQSVDVSSGETTTINFTAQLPPLGVTVNPVLTPTEDNSQTLSGTMTVGANVAITVDTSAVVGIVTYPTSTTWECLVSNLAEGVNTFSVTATDGISQYSAPSITVDYQPVQIINTIVVTEASYDKRKNVLTVKATSNYENAQLQVDGYGPMTFTKLFKGKYYWTFSTVLSVKPATVTVSGPEGSVSAEVQ